MKNTCFAQIRFRLVSAIAFPIFFVVVLACVFLLPENFDSKDDDYYFPN
jgi:predicted membrane protein